MVKFGRERPYCNAGDVSIVEQQIAIMPSTFAKTDLKGRNQLRLLRDGICDHDIVSELKGKMRVDVEKEANE